MKKIILYIIFFTGLWGAYFGLKRSLEQKQTNYELQTQSTIDSLQNVIDSLQLPVDTIQYESIDTTVINWPWCREEF